MTDRERNKAIAFRVTPAERKQIDVRIRRSGLTQREYLLHAALGQTVYVVEDLKPFLTELRACGRNLNQLTVLAHEGRIHTADLERTVETLGKTYEAVNALLTEKSRVIAHGNL